MPFIWHWIFIKAITVYQQVQGVVTKNEVLVQGSVSKTKLSQSNFFIDIFIIINGYSPYMLCVGKRLLFIKALL